VWITHGRGSGVENRMTTHEKKQRSIFQRLKSLLLQRQKFFCAAKKKRVKQTVRDIGSELNSPFQISLQEKIFQKKIFSCLTQSLTAKARGASKTRSCKPRDRESFFSMR
jgi:hypothetical protein